MNLSLGQFPNYNFAFMCLKWQVFSVSWKFHEGRLPVLLIRGSPQCLVHTGSYIYICSMDGQTNKWTDGEVDRWPRILKRNNTCRFIFEGSRKKKSTLRNSSFKSFLLFCCRVNHSHTSSNVMAERTLNLLVGTFMNHIMDHYLGLGDRRTCIQILVLWNSRVYWSP